MGWVAPGHAWKGAGNVTHRDRSPDRPARSVSLHRLSCRGRHGELTKYRQYKRTITPELIQSVSRFFNKIRTLWEAQNALVFAEEAVCMQEVSVTVLHSDQSI